MGLYSFVFAGVGEATAVYILLLSKPGKSPVDQKSMVA